jgi:hypothetical protein
MREIVCAVEPKGTYHQALATFLEGHGIDVVLVCNNVAALNRRTLDRTWGKSDLKDAHNLCDLLERGLLLLYSLPDERLATLRRFVRPLRSARTDLAAAKARFRNTLLPALAPPLARPCPHRSSRPSRRPYRCSCGPGGAGRSPRWGLPSRPEMLANPLIAWMSKSCPGRSR